MKWLVDNWDQVLIALGEHIAISLTAPKIWAGAFTACALAVSVDMSLARVERRLRRHVA